MGWERKRGKLREFNRLLRGERTSFTIEPHDASALFGAVRYIITLDEDTELLRDGARKLIGTIDHPLNRPEIDLTTGLVRRGYGIVEPRSALRFSDRGATLFARIFGAYPGVEAYSSMISDLHLDLFGDGLFHGKGIYDIDAIERTMEGRIPDGLVLSHDLLEGLYARVGIASEAFIFEGFPPRFREFSLRAHRWIRGDWQVLSWIFPPRAAGLSAIARYRLADNLRRSLVAPAAAVALVVGSFAAASSWWWALLVALAVGSGAVVSALLRSIDALFSLKRRFMLRYRIETALVECSVAAFKILLSVVVLLHQAAESIDAIGRALWRMFVSRRKLLEWRTALDVSASTKGSLAETAAYMKATLLLPVLGLVWCLANDIVPPQDLLLIAFLWTLAPLVVTLTGIRTDGRRALPAHDQLFLRKIAARTTWYFSDMAKPEFHGLVPDLLQEEPESKRHSHGLGISPTNLGMYLVSLASAHALGLLTIGQFSQRLYRAIERAGRMERYRGHFLNWYEMERLIPLEPRYVSSVDSANLALALLTVRRAALAAVDAPVFAPVLFSGLDAELAIVQDECSSIVERGEQKQVDRKLLAEIAQAATSARMLVAQRVGTSLDVDAAELALTGVIHQTVRMRNALETLKLGSDPACLERLFVCLRNTETFVADLRDAIDRSCAFARIPVVSATAEDVELRKKTAQLRSVFQRIPTIRELASGMVRERIAKIGIGEAIDLSKLARPEKDRAHLWFREILSRLDAAERDARDIASRFSRVASECRRYYDEMDFAFLYDEERGLFRGGYSVTRKELDEGVYDLLASEANSASIVAIARGDVPKKHWRYLGRKLVRSARGDTLAVSWAGSLFEYLGTLLFFEIPSESFWGVSAQRAIAAHREFARKRGIPWGMGESACARFNAQQQYHYQAFGEQSIGLKRDLSQSTVVAPYTSALALAFSPSAAVANLRWLARLGTLGVYGFYDAFDLTSTRSLRPERGVPARVYFAHHQGFIMASIGNALADQVLRRALVDEPEMDSITQLFEEQMPETVPAEPLALPPASPTLPLQAFEVNEVRRRFVPVRAQRQRSQFLSNGAYHLRITSAGSGSSQYEHVALTHEPLDALGESGGSFIYLFDRSRGALWSPSYMPTRTAGEHTKTSFGESSVVFEKTYEGVQSTLSVSVHPMEPIEVRVLELTNRRSVPVTLSIGACSEVSLASVRDAHAHRSYQQLFVRSEAIPERHAILAYRKDPRDHTKIVAAAFAMVPEAPLSNVRSFRSRESFFGPLLRIDDPISLRTAERESGVPEYPLDPAAGFVGECTLAPGETRRIAFSVIAGTDRKSVESKLREFGVFRRLAKIVEAAERDAPRRLSSLGVSAAQAEVFTDLASVVAERRNASRPAHFGGVHSRAALWKCGVSGELPVVLLRVSNASDLGAVRIVLVAAAYFLAKGIAIDIVILNDHPGGYLKTFEDEVDFLVRTAGLSPGLAGGVTHVRSEQLSAPERLALIASATVSIDPKRGTLADQVRGMLSGKSLPLPNAFVPTRSRRDPRRSMLLSSDERSPFTIGNDLGGWDTSAREFAIRVGPDQRPRSPWSNILTGETAGTLVNDRGAAFTWIENSHENKLTVAYTDPASVRTAEAFYVRDDETGEYWSPQPIVGDRGSDYEILHGLGVSKFRTHEGDLALSLEMTVHPSLPIKFASLTISNTGVEARSFSVYGYFEFLLGKTLFDTRPHFAFDRVGGSALSVTSLFHASRPTDIAFAGVVSGIDAFTTNKDEFLGRFREMSMPVGLERSSLSGTLAPDAEPCVALLKTCSLDPGETRTVTFFIGMTLPEHSLEDLISFADRVDAYPAAARAQAERWTKTLSSVHVTLPSASTTALVNAWAPYQMIASRLEAKAGPSQISGAFGFRDQLQDALAMLWIDPAWVRTHILRSAAHQFVEGDALSWWLPTSEFGARTRMSDPHLWLAFTTLRYIRATGDRGILDVRVPFLEGNGPLSGSRRVDAGVFQPAQDDAPLSEHLLRAVERSLGSGPHGLPLIGDADWNDGFNNVGTDGKGESVWLAMFLIDILDDMAEMLDSLADPDRAFRYRSAATAYREAIRTHGWDGKWYRRAYTDDGVALGSASGRTFAVDTLTQSWAVFSGIDPVRASEAVRESASALAIWNGHVPLLSPVLRGGVDLGTISDYPPGVRENGSQYNHAALWFAAALAEIGDPDLGKVALDAVDPFLRSEKEGVQVYRGEPYAIAAEVYSAPTYPGRAGWTWYTASAGLYYRVVLESFLGLERLGNTLAIRPHLPKDWDGARVELQCGSASYHLIYRIVSGDSATPIIRIISEGRVIPGDRVAFVDDGAIHELVIEIAVSSDTVPAA